MNENSYIKIEEYINGSMSRDEQLSFEAELITNEELSVAFKIYKQIETEMRTHENCSGQEALLRKSLEKLNIKYLGNEFQQQAGLEEATPVIYINEDQKVEEDSNSGKIKRWKWLAAASIVICFVSLGVRWLSAITTKTI
jgi:hypothetical protein